jgi:hypothetical protein
MEDPSMKRQHLARSISLGPCLLLLLGLTGSGYSYQAETRHREFRFSSSGQRSFSASGQTTTIQTSALTESEKLAQSVEVSGGPKIIVEDRGGALP